MLASVVVIALAGASVNAIAAAAPRPASRREVAALPELAAGIVGEINAARAEHRLAPLRLSPALGRAAVSHTVDMAVRGFFSHRSHEGTPAWLRLTRFYTPAGFRRWRIGEALLWHTGVLSPATAVRDWLASPEHRAVLLAPDFREIGVSAVHAPEASGVFGGPATLVTADFGDRSR